MSATPVRSILSLPLDLGPQALGALGLYSDRTYGFGADAEELAEALTSHIALLLQNVQRAEQLPANLGRQDITSGA
jgi:GAF domain-containing protein